MLQDTIDTFVQKITYHNYLVKNISIELHYYDGSNPIGKVRELKEEIENLKQYLPQDVINAQEPLLEWNEETMKDLPEELRKNWLVFEKQVEKIKDFCELGPYINALYPNFNLSVTLITMVNNLGKASRNYVKHSCDDTKDLFSGLKDLVMQANLKKATQKELNDHSKFEKLKEKYPEFNFGDRVISEEEKKVANLRVDVLSGSSSRTHQYVDEKDLKKKAKASKSKASKSKAK